MDPAIKRKMWGAYADDLRNKADIVDVIVSEGVLIKKRGRDWIGLSPFTHEVHPSFRVSREKQIFKCYSSGRGGTVITFVMMKRGCSFDEAVKILAKRYRFGYVRWYAEKKRKACQTISGTLPESTYPERVVPDTFIADGDDLPF
ncbi:MAG: hypothetical protein HGA67_04395 [Candidatus Yonathbacteria bacterium]|nr:hypothetical protein [Candidatus Yonathbacteria bacterium]